MNKPKNGKAGTYVADDSLYPLVFISCIIAPHNLPTICPANIPPPHPHLIMIAVLQHVTYLLLRESYWLDVFLFLQPMT